jgi:hypothetical protein
MLTGSTRPLEVRIDLFQMLSPSPRPRRPIGLRPPLNSQRLQLVRAKISPAPDRVGCAPGYSSTLQPFSADGPNFPCHRDCFRYDKIAFVAKLQAIKEADFFIPLPTFGLKRIRRQ